MKITSLFADKPYSAVAIAESGDNRCSHGNNKSTPKQTAIATAL